ncbi:MAG: alpha/beta hydrolase fold domain-containing protein [Myxococcales bacterium]
MIRPLVIGAGRVRCARRGRHASSRIAVAGDSAGGNLALALQLALRERGTPQARVALLISLWLDLTASRASCREADPLDSGQTWFLLQHARDFAPGSTLSSTRPTTCRTIRSRSSLFTRTRPRA